jgi:hypothetical protein
MAVTLAQIKADQLQARKARNELTTKLIASA